MEKPRYRAYLCCGPNCGPKGASALLDFLSAEVERLGLDTRVSVAATGCQAHCESGPTMVIFPGPTYYQAIDRERLVRIVAQHFIGDQPVAEYFWTGVPRRILPGKSQLKPLTSILAAQAPEKPIQTIKPKPKRPQREVDDFKW
jgi:(2Fe-2S) ferredoxin